MRIAQIISVFTAILLGSSLCVAQTSGTITGEVRDSSGSLIANAAVTVVNTGTNATRVEHTNTDGIYVSPTLPPGSYEVKVEVQGFKSETKTNIDLQVQQTARIDFALQVGQVNESVEINASAEMLNTDNATVGTVIENRRIVELPLNGRDYLQLVQLSPNVTAGFTQPQSSDSRQGGTRSTENLSIAGQRSTFNHYTLDGIENTDVNFNLYIFQPSIDALQEFKVQSGVYPAEFGREVSQVNVSTKSSTNQYHVTLFEFLRNYKLDAAQYAFTSTHPPNQPFKWNQYGFTLGGPLSIPKLFNAKDKLFFMTNFEGFNVRSTLNTPYNVPTLAMRQGDFSSLLPGTQIWDPFGRTQNANGTINVQPIAGNIIPASRIPVQALKTLQFVPVPNQPTTGVLNNYLATTSNPIDKAQFTLRLDFNESANSTWFGRYSWTDEGSLTPGIGLAGTALETNAEQYMIQNTRVFSPTKVNEFRFGINRFYNALAQTLSCKENVVAELGLPALNTSNCQVWGIPNIRNINPLSGWGDNANGPYVLNDAVFQVIDNFSWIAGKHSIRFGGEVRRDRYNQLGNEFPRAAYSFSNSTTQNPNTLTGGYGMAGYMLGAPSEVDAAYGLAFEQMRGTSQAYYIDDSWRVAPSVTVNIGLRYELTPPFWDRSGHETNTQVPFVAGFAGVSDPNLHPTDVRSGTGNFYEGLPFVFNGVKVARDGRLGDRLYQTDYTNFAPRLGIAWSPNSKTSIRTGVGLFYSQDSNNSRFDLARTLGGRVNNVGRADLPNLTWTNFVTPGAIITIDNPSLYGVLYDIRTPRVLQYVFNVQQELSKSLVLEVGYEGSQGRHLQSLYNVNEPTPSAKGSVASRSPFPEIGIMQTVQGGGVSSYNSLGTKLTKRLSGGLTVLAAYTWSRSIDDASAIRGQGDTIFPQNSRCLACEKAASAFNVPQRFVASILYELPFGKGKPFANRGGFVNQLVGGWQVGSIYTLQSGLPGYPTPGPDRSNTGIGNSRDRLNATGISPYLDNPTPNQWFNTAAFALEPFGTFGNAGRNTVPEPGRNDWDFSMLKDFRITERQALQFRFETFNFLNHPNWGNPGLSWGTNATPNPNFGLITSTAIPMRQIQFGLKYAF